MSSYTEDNPKLQYFNTKHGLAKSLQKVTNIQLGIECWSLRIHPLTCFKKLSAPVRDISVSVGPAMKSKPIW